MVVVGVLIEKDRAAPARQPAADHAVHGDHRPHLRARGPVADWSGARSRTGSSSASRTCRWSGWRTPPSIISQFDIVRAGIAAILVAVARGLSSRTRASGVRCAPWPTITRRRSPWASRCSTSGRSCGRWPGFVALVAGLMWGVRNGVQYALTFTRAEGTAGAHPRRLRVDPRRHRRRPDHRRVARSWRRSISGRFVGGGIESWFAYVIASCSFSSGRRACSGKNH